MERIRELLLLILEKDYVHGFGLDRAVDMAIDRIEQRPTEETVEDLSWDIEYFQDELRAAENDLDWEIAKNEKLERRVRELEEDIEQLQAEIAKLRS